MKLLKNGWLLLAGILFMTAATVAPLALRAEDFRFAIFANSPTGTKSVCVHAPTNSLLTALNQNNFASKQDETGFIYSLIGYDGPMSSNPAAQSHFWGLWNQDNGKGLTFSELGAQNLQPKDGSLYVFNFGDGSIPTNQPSFDSVCPPATEPVAPVPNPQPTPTTPPTESIPTDPTITYLESNYDNQSSITKDWGALALAASGRAVPTQNLTTDSVLTNSRNALARNAQGLDASNQLNQIKNSYHDNQFGDPELINDDIFATLAITGGDPNWLADHQAVFVTITNSQRSDGSFGFAKTGPGDVDVTSAAVWALATKNPTPTDIIAKAMAFIGLAQNSDGGMGYKPGANSNIASSAWALMAYHSVNQDNGTLANYLRNQARDGVWLQAGQVDYLNTAYAALALSGKTLPVTSQPQSQPRPISSPKSQPITRSHESNSTADSSSHSEATVGSEDSSGCWATASASADGSNATSSASASCN